MKYLVAALVCLFTAKAYALPVKDVSKDAFAGYEEDFNRNYCKQLNENWDPYTQDNVDRGAPMSKEGRSKWTKITCTIDVPSFTKHYNEENDENLPSGLCAGAVSHFNAQTPDVGMNCRDEKPCYEEFTKKVKAIKCIYDKGEAKLELKGTTLEAHVSSAALQGGAFVHRDFKKLFQAYKAWADKKGQ
jgi:hypothetical protein